MIIATLCEADCNQRANVFIVFIYLGVIKHLGRIPPKCLMEPKI
ncbi:unnamed protein product, partial [marine sediment metagenome]